MGTFLPLSGPRITSIDEEYHVIDTGVLPTPPEVLQLQQDTINVLEGVVLISSFPQEYQERIKTYYRFSATRYGSKADFVAKRTLNTQDII
jgi:hypothetical protein